MSQKRTFSTSRSLRNPTGNVSEATEPVHAIVRMAQNSLPLPEGGEALLIRSGPEVVSQVQSSFFVTQQHAAVIVLSILAAIFVAKATPYILESCGVVKDLAQDGAPNTENMSSQEIETSKETFQTILSEVNLTEKINLYLQRAEQIENMLRKIVENNIYYYFDFFKANPALRGNIRDINEGLKLFGADFTSLVTNEDSRAFLAWTGQLDAYVSLSNRITVSSNWFNTVFREFIIDWMDFVRIGQDTGIDAWFMPVI